jgi:hypothetical protein
LIEKTYHYCRFCIALLVGLIQEDLTVFERVKNKTVRYCEWCVLHVTFNIQSPNTSIEGAWVGRHQTLKRGPKA